MKSAASAPSSRASLAAAARARLLLRHGRRDAAEEDAPEEVEVTTVTAAELAQERMILLPVGGSRVPAVPLGDGAVEELVGMEHRAEGQRHPHAVNERRQRELLDHADDPGQRRVVAPADLEGLDVVRRDGRARAAETRRHPSCRRPGSRWLYSAASGPPERTSLTVSQPGGKKGALAVNSSTTFSVLPKGVSSAPGPVMFDEALAEHRGLARHGRGALPPPRRPRAMGAPLADHNRRRDEPREDAAGPRHLPARLHDIRGR